MSATATVPTYTRIPDEVMDALFELETVAEIKAALYVAKRTLGFRKDSDRISLTQFLSGITKADGTVLDKGCGIKSKSTIVAALEKLTQKAILKVSDLRGHFQAKEYTFAIAPSESEIEPSKSDALPSKTASQNHSEKEKGYSGCTDLGTETVPTYPSQRESKDSLGEELSPKSQKSVGPAPVPPPDDDESKERTDLVKRYSREQIVAYIREANLAAAERSEKGDQAGVDRALEAVRKAQDLLKRYDQEKARMSVSVGLKNPRNTPDPMKYTAAILARMIQSSGEMLAPNAGGGKVVMPERPEATEAQQSKAQEILQRLAAARAKADPMALVRIEAEHDNAPEKAKQVAIEARLSRYVDYLNLTRYEMLKRLYGECVVNPNPHMESKKLLDWALAIADFDPKKLMLVCDAFFDGQGRAASLGAIYKNLEAKGIDLNT